MKKLSLDKILQTQGFGTRRECRNLILHGAVSIADEVVTDYQMTPDTADLDFTVDGASWHYREHVYIALNKPAGVECSRRPAVHRGVLSLLPDQFTLRDVQPVGRLDHDTTGLLLLSDDGSFIHAQSSPKRHVTKTYVATTQDPVTPELVAQLQAGVKLADEPAPLAARARQLDSHQVEIILDQGKYHQVRRMLAAAGHHCVALQRTAIGGLTLEGLGLVEGAWCYLDDAKTGLLSPE
ncbi:MAG: RNA pseudouridine synthase [Rhodocyclaceae bacterium]|jgi:16S rRNA pseudouridine516 synthase|nr:RNA pseudouridine synthase [Rhodocyclaceae bacterium]